jgi:hypothetical protein
MRKTDHIPLAEIELVTYEIVQKDRVEFSCPCSCCYASACVLVRASSNIVVDAWEQQAW